MEEPLSDEELRLLHQIAQSGALQASPNPAREGCPPLAVLAEMARAPWPADHPFYAHVKHCSPCLQAMLAHRSAHSRRSRFLRPILAVTACILLICSLLWWRSRLSARRPGLAPITAALWAQAPIRVVDLSEYGTYRGDSTATPTSIDLPATAVRVRLILPRFSEVGVYTVGVTRDRGGHPVVAAGTGTATLAEGRTVVTVLLDLRSTPAGPYFLATTHDGEESSSYYPLQILP